MCIRILLAEDHVITRQGIKRLLEDEGDFEVVGEADDGEQVVAQGFIAKRAASSDLTDCVRAVDAGRYFPKSFAYVSANWGAEAG